MITILAHHLEMHHVPILGVLFAVGFVIGWQNVGRFLPKPQIRRS
ncbi:MAG TPA: hypothetical protein VMM76_24970 [Pirellulaceae bacterium]|nr:hypothetical protein [Pirellulaceae bacterium]